jgi:orotate phosphoribosyltransferase-like protein
MKKVEVIWRDIINWDGWHEMDDVDNFATSDDNIVSQIGYLYEQDENHIVLVNAFFADKSKFGTIEKIPLGCVIKITELK